MVFLVHTELYVFLIPQFYYQQLAYTFGTYYRCLNTGQVFMTECHQEYVCVCVAYRWGNFLNTPVLTAGAFKAHNAIKGGETLCTTCTFFYELKATQKTAGSYVDTSDSDDETTSKINDRHNQVTD